jgi:DNA-directed RNA polymerase specialized sigma24 family protein
MKKQYHNETNIITADTLQQMANAITIRALKTNYAKSANETIRELLFDAITFAHNPETTQGGDGADLVQDTALYLWGYAGKSLEDTTTDGQTDKEGNPITILRGAFRNIRKIIYGHEQRQYKQDYLTDYENNNGEIAVPFLWDMPTYTDYITATEIITALELTENQKYILNKRLQGCDLAEIAKLKNVSYQSIQNALAKIGKKYIALYGEIAVPVLEKILKK